MQIQADETVECGLANDETDTSDENATDAQKLRRRHKEEAEKKV